MEEREDQAQSQAEQGVIESLIQLIKALVTMISEIFEMAVLEVRLAGKSVVRIIGLSFILIFLFATIWLSLMGFIVYGFAILRLNMAFGFLTVIGLNLFIAVIMLVMIVQFKKNLSLPRTRAQLTMSGKNYELKLSDKNS